MNEPCSSRPSSGALAAARLAGCLLLGIGLMALPAAGQEDECLYFATAFSDLVAVNTRTLAVADLLPRSGVIDPAVHCTRYCAYEIPPRETGMADLVIVGKRAYVARSGRDRQSPGTVEVVDLHTRTVERTVPVGVGPYDMKLANGKLYVAAYTDSRLDVIDLATFAATTIEGFVAPMALAVTPDASRLFVGSVGARGLGRVDVVDTSSQQVVKGVALRRGPASALTLAGDLLLVAVIGEVWGYDLDPTRRFTIPVGHLISDVAAAGNRL